MKGSEPKYLCEANGHSINRDLEVCPIDGSRLIPTNGRRRVGAGNSAARLAQTETTAPESRRPTPPSIAAKPEDALKALAAEQMKKSEKLFMAGKEAAVARLLVPGEKVELVFGGQINGKQALVALTDRRMLAVCGLLGKSDTIDYAAIGQVNTGLTKVEIRGAGVHLVMKAVPRKDQLVNALQARRTRSAAPAASPSPSDPAALLIQLATLRDSGVLTEEEFTAKKAEVLGRL